MVSARGIEHAPNLPTEEVFTVPDPDRSTVMSVSPVPRSSGHRLIDQARLEFRDGRVVDVQGGDGVEALEEFIARDAGTGRLGELALVDNDSPVGQLKRNFGVIRLDENCVSYIALGFGLPDAVEEDDQRAVNDSGFHVDLMVGSEQLNVTATDATHLLLDAGEWNLTDQ